MKIFEGYKKAVEIYNNHTQTQDGRGYVSKLNRMGVSKEYMEWITVNTIVSKIPLYIVLNAYKDWKRYVIPYYKNANILVPNINQLSYKQVVKIINKCKRYYNSPNELYNKNGIFVGYLKKYENAKMLPINTNWCIMNSPKRFDEFCSNGKVGYYIVNKNMETPYRHVIAIVSNGEVEYWDSKNCRMTELPDEIKRFKQYESTLPYEVKQMFYNEAAKQGEEIEKSKLQNESTGCVVNKRNMPLSESHIRSIVKETLRQYLQI